MQTYRIPQRDTAAGKGERGGRRRGVGVGGTRFCSNDQVLSPIHVSCCGFALAPEGKPCSSSDPRSTLPARKRTKKVAMIKQTDTSEVCCGLMHFGASHSFFFVIKKKMVACRLPSP